MLRRCSSRLAQRVDSCLPILNTLSNGPVNVRDAFSSYAQRVLEDNSVYFGSPIVITAADGPETFRQKIQMWLQQLELECRVGAPDCVIVYGGDGTINSYLNAGVQQLRGVPVALVPCGHMNAVAASFSASFSKGRDIFRQCQHPRKVHLPVWGAYLDEGLAKPMGLVRRFVGTVGAGAWSSAVAGTQMLGALSEQYPIPSVASPMALALVRAALMPSLTAIQVELLINGDWRVDHSPQALVTLSQLPCQFQRCRLTTGGCSISGSAALGGTVADSTVSRLRMLHLLLREAGTEQGSITEDGVWHWGGAREARLLVAADAPPASITIDGDPFRIPPGTALHLKEMDEVLTFWF